MCLYPTRMRNKKYVPTKKNGGRPPELKYSELAMITVPCGICWECRRKKRSEWMVRLIAEMKTHGQAQFVTLTLDDKAIEKIEKSFMKENDGKRPDANQVAAIAIKRWRERRRAKKLKPLKYMLITELGHKGTERVHLHGIIFGSKDDVRSWPWGFTFEGDYVNERSITYITKYIMKRDEKHKGYMPRIFSANGIGKTYCEENYIKHSYKGEKTETKIQVSNRVKVEMPAYMKRKIYTDEEREYLALHAIWRGLCFIGGRDVTHMTHAQRSKVREVVRREKRELGWDTVADYKRKRYLATNSKLEFDKNLKKWKN